MITRFVFCAVALLAACDGRPTASVGPDPDPAPIATMVRVQNNSSYDFLSVVVNGIAFGAIDAGRVSDAQVLMNAYELAQVQVDATIGSYRIQPIDFVGEQRLIAGEYTYVLQFDDDMSPTQLLMQTVGG